MSYTRHSAYRQASAASWTRIDMLLALYDAAVLSAVHGRQAVLTNKEQSLVENRIRSQRLITQLIAGIDTEQGELPQNVHRLLTFCLMQICGRSEEEWNSVVDTLTQLKDAFQEIRDQAVELEKSGHVPALDLGIPDQTLAVV